MEDFKIMVGHKIHFVDEVPSYDVKAANERFVVCTRKLNKKHDKSLLQHEVNMGAFCSLDEAYKAVKDNVVYTLIDLKEKIRSPHFFTFNPYDFTTQNGCEECLSELEAGKCELSRRKKVDLQIEAVI